MIGCTMLMYWDDLTLLAKVAKEAGWLDVPHTPS